MVVCYVQRGLIADFDGVRHDIHVQQHVSTDNVQHYILAIRDDGLHLFVANPVCIANMFRINDVFALRPPTVAARDYRFNITVEEVKIVVC